jgi:outer membrane protein assembly factor BamB
LPAAQANTEWAQSGGNARKSVGHVALGNTLGVAWTASIGEGSGKYGRLGGGPVVADGKVFTIDTLGTVRAFDASTGSQLWSARFGEVGDNRTSLYGGGVAYDGGRVYATNGLGYAPRWMPATAHRCGRSSPPARCAASPRLPMAPSM